MVVLIENTMRNLTLIGLLDCSLWNTNFIHFYCCENKLYIEEINLILGLKLTLYDLHENALNTALSESLCAFMTTKTQPVSRNMSSF